MLSATDARTLLDSIETSHVVGLRDRALIGLMVYSFARISAVVRMRVKDYYPNGKRYWIRLHEKGGKFHEVPVHHTAEEYLDAYIEAAGIADEKNKPLFRTTRGKTRTLTERALDRFEAHKMIKRRAKEAGLPRGRLLATPSGPLVSRPIWRTAGQSNTLSRSRRMNRRERLSSMTEQMMRSA